MKYIEIIGEYYPEYQVNSPDAYDYDAIIWGAEQPIAKEALDAYGLVMYKTERIIEMSEQAEQDIVDGFYSTALGSPGFWYDSSQEDQLNLIGSTTAGDTSAAADVELAGCSKFGYTMHSCSTLSRSKFGWNTLSCSMLSCNTFGCTTCSCSTLRCNVPGHPWL